MGLGKLAAEFETCRVDLWHGYLFEFSMSSMNSSEPPLKKVKVEHEPHGPLGCPFCFESCRGRGRGVDALVCKGCETTWLRRAGKGWDGTCPKCRTDGKVEHFVMPKGQGDRLLSRLRGRKGGGGGEGVCQESEQRMWTWRTCGVGGWVYRTNQGPGGLKQHKAFIHAIDVVWHHCPELGCEYKAKNTGSI